MSKLRVMSFSVSLDGFGAGPDQSLQSPLGEMGSEIFEWVFPTRVFQRMHGGGGDGETGVDNQLAEEGFENMGAWILGRNMFGPVRGSRAWCVRTPRSARARLRGVQGRRGRARQPRLPPQARGRVKIPARFAANRGR